MYHIVEFGAVSNGVMLYTAAIQRAIDTCAVQYGGTTLIPADTFISAPMLPKRHVTIQLDDDTVLRGSRTLTDAPFPFTERHY